MPVVRVSHSAYGGWLAGYKSGLYVLAVSHPFWGDPPVKPTPDMPATKLCIFTEPYFIK